ncbi:MAG: ABC transporter ATP-binding protein [Chloroflexota bacterium]|nr:ABC transporter ATP-binding protein [Chloroflexota bacterium]
MSSSQVIIDIENLTRVYDVGAEQVTAVKDVTLQIPPGQFIALVGRSGSGKTTLLNLMAGLDKPTSGSILFEGEDLAAMGEKELTNIRRHKVGFVFQAFGLLPLLSAFENVELPLRISGFGVRQREERTREALGIVGLLPRANHRPYELSGGEQQRVAIARAIVTRPPLILADEPTGELDSTNAQSIFGLFREMVETHGITVVAATHDSTLLAMADQVNEMRDGSIVGHLEGEDLQSRLEDIQASRYRDRPSDGDGASEV